MTVRTYWNGFDPDSADENNELSKQLEEPSVFVYKMQINDLR